MPSVLSLFARDEKYERNACISIWTLLNYYNINESLFLNPNVYLTDIDKKNS